MELFLTYPPHTFNDSHLRNHDLVMTHSEGVRDTSKLRSTSTEGYQRLYVGIKHYVCNRIQTIINNNEIYF